MTFLVQDKFYLTDRNILTIPEWNQLDKKLVVGFTTRNNGASHDPFNSFNLGLHVGDNDQDVISNRNMLASELGIKTEHWIVAEQIHDNKIQKVTKREAGAGAQSLDTVLKGVDGIYTKDTGLLLTSLYADCVPLYFFAPENEIIGLAHAGWKGTVKEIGPKMVKIWKEVEDVPLSNVYVAIGPSISKTCYEVDSSVISQVNQLFPRNELIYTETKNNKYLLDLKKLNYYLLVEAGVPSNNILMSNYCTYKSQLFFSYRKEKGKTGRMMSFLGRFS